MEVLSVNGRSADELLRVIRARLPGDGFIETGRTARLSRSFPTLHWLFVAPDSVFTITARDTEGRLVTATLAGVRSADRARNQNPVNAGMTASATALDGPRDHVSLRFVGGGDVAHLRIRGFEGDSFPQQLDAAFRTMADRHARALILDLRGNAGGVDTYGARLVSHLVDRPFRYFDRIHVPTIRPSFATWKPSTFEDLRSGVEADPAGGYLVTARLHPGVAEQAPAATPFRGPVVFLLDGGTFSTAADVAAILHHHRRATFVGEESGGAYQGNNSGLNALIVLPHSRLRLKIPMYGYWNAVTAGADGRGVRPDHPVPRRIADLLRGVDAQWDLALALAGRAIAR
jgi:C-terminal processing protease CtpA/Prc